MGQIAVQNIAWSILGCAFKIDVLPSWLMVTDPSDVINMGTKTGLKRAKKHWKMKLKL